MVRRRDDLAGHRPGLQQLHDAAARAGHRDASSGRPALQAAAGARDRGLRDAQRKRRSVGEALPPLAWKPEHVALIHERDVRRDAGRHLGASFVNAPYQTGGKTGTAQAVGIKAEREVQRREARGAPARPRAVHRLRTDRGAARGAGDDGRERRLRPDAAAPIARRVFDYLLLGPVAERRGHGRRRSSASRGRRSARRARRLGAAARPTSRRGASRAAAGAGGGRMALRRAPAPRAGPPEPAAHRPAAPRASRAERRAGPT